MSEHFVSVVSAKIAQYSSFPFLSFPLVRKGYNGHVLHLQVWMVMHELGDVPVSIVALLVL